MARAVDRVRLGGCLVFVPPVDGRWRERLGAFARSLPSPPTVIVGVDGKLAEPKRSLLARLLVAAPAVPPSSRLLELCQVLRMQGLRVVVLHRSSGVELDEPMLRRL